MELTNGLMVAYSAIVSMAVLPIYAGSYLSVDQKGVETMSSEDAWKFPFVGSGVLFGLYILFKLFSKDYINILLTAYFLIFGVLAVSGTLKPLMNQLFSKPLKSKKYSFLPPWKTKDPIEIELDKADYVSIVLATLIGIWYVSTKHWIANNILGLSFSIQGIAMLSLGSYKNGCILLGGLFVYDIFWVFGTDVMVTVAKSFDAPIKLLFPKDLAAETLQFSMLGLGDIVIPGIFIALLLRFDIHRSKLSKLSTPLSPTGSVKNILISKKKKKPISELYFNVCLVAYFIGLATTIFIMHSFQSAQPALLYLVPACLGSSFILAQMRGESSTLFAYEEKKRRKERRRKERIKF